MQCACVVGVHRWPQSYHVNRYAVIGRLVAAADVQFKNGHRQRSVLGPFDLIEATFNCPHTSSIRVAFRCR